MTNARNSDGMTWLEILVIRGDSRSLDVALSPKRSFSWKLRLPGLLDWSVISSLEERAQRQRDPIILLIIETHDHLCDMKQKYVNSFWETEEDLFGKDEFMFRANDENGNAFNDFKTNATRFFRFVHDWGGTNHLPVNVLSCLVRKGCHIYFKLLFEQVDKSWFFVGEDRIQPNNDDDSYIQPELSSDSEMAMLHATFFTICLIGESANKISGAMRFNKETYLKGIR